MVTLTVNPGDDTQAAVDAAAAGDVVVLKDGDGRGHRGFKVLHRRFPADNPLTVRGEPGSSITTGVNTGEGVNVEDAAGVVLEGFNVVGMAAGARTRVAGVRVVESDDVTVRGVHSLDNLTWGFFTGFSNRVLFEDCLAARSGQQHGFYASNSGSDHAFRRCRAEGNAASGFHFNGDASQESAYGRPRTGVMAGVLLEGCSTAGNGRLGGAAVNMDGVRGFRVSGHRGVDLAGGFAAFRGDGAEPTSGGVLEGCSFVAAAGGPQRPVVAFRDGAGRSVVWGCEMRTPYDIRPELLVESGPAAADVVSDYNWCRKFSGGADDNFVTLADWRATGQDAHTADYATGGRPAGVPPAPPPPRPAYAFELLAVRAPTAAPFGSSYRVEADVRNAGTQPWGPDVRFGTWGGPGDVLPTNHPFFGAARLDHGRPSVPPGGVATFSGTLRAVFPAALKFAPLREGDRWFAAPLVAAAVAVTDPAPAVPPPPAEDHAGAILSAAVSGGELVATARNDGREAWPAGGLVRVGVEGDDRAVVPTARLVLAAETRPGAVGEFRAAATPRTPPGEVGLRLVLEGVRWFGPRFAATA